MRTVRGKVLRAPDAGPGLLTSGGSQYAFVLEGMWRSDDPPHPGSTVDIDFDNAGAPVAIRAVSDQQLVREQAAASMAEARAKSGAVAATVLARFGKATLIAEGLLLLGWFFLAFLSIHSFAFNRSATLWQLLSYLSAGNPIVAVGSEGSGTGSGLYGLLGLVSVFAPLLPFFWRDRLAHIGSLLPLAYLLGVALKVYLSLPAVGADTDADLTQEQLHLLWTHMSFGAGAYVCFGAGLYFACRGVAAFLLQKARAQVL